MADEKKQEEKPVDLGADIFNRPMGITDTSKANVKVYSPDTGEEVISPELAGGAGAVLGYGVNKVAPTQQVSVKGLDQAKVNQQLAEKLYQDRLLQTEGLRTTHVENLDNIKLELDAAKAKLADAAVAYEEAQAKARQIGAIVEPPPKVAPLEVLPGQLSEGAMSHSNKMGEITQANTVRKGIAGTAKGLSPEQRMPLTGYAQNSRLIVPDYLAQAPVYSPEQIAAQQDLARAEAQRKAAQQQAAAAQGKFESAGRRPPVSAGQQQRVATAAEKSSQAAEKLRLLQAQSPSTLSKLGMALGKTPLMNIIGGAMSAAELAEMINNIDRGEYGKAAMNAMGGVGGAMMMAPNPAAKVIGAGLSAIPLGYQGYQALTNKE
jgi:hypothetical protein